MVHIVTIAWNISGLIECQYRLLTTYLQDPFKYTVVDNSTSEVHLEDFCREHSIDYYRVPESTHKDLDWSHIYHWNRHHGQALEWAWNNIFLEDKSSDVVGFLDHDLMPIAFTSIENKVKGVYGWRRYGHEVGTPKGDKWYLWPGFSFYRLDYIKQFPPMSFDMGWRPDGSLWGDTGAGDYESVFSRVPEEYVEEEVFIRQGFSPDYKKWQMDMRSFHRASDWVHLASPIHWDSVKYETVQKMLSSI